MQLMWACVHSWHLRAGTTEQDMLTAGMEEDYLFFGNDVKAKLLCLFPGKQSAVLGYCTHEPANVRKRSIHWIK